MPKENPDNINYIGLGPQARIKDAEGNDTNIEERYLIPVAGMLRFLRVKKADGTERNILQQFQWSSEDGKHDWYTIPLVEED